MKSHSDEIHLFLRIEPDISKLTHQNGIKLAVLKDGKPYIHKTTSLQNLEAFYVAHLKKYAPEKPWTCPIEMRTTWFFRRPKSASGLYKTTKPDTDNLIKTLKDCMKRAGFFKDDALVVYETTSKVWCGENRPHGIDILMIDLSRYNETEI